MKFYDTDAADREIAKVSTTVMYPQPMTVRYWSADGAVDGCGFDESPDGMVFYWNEIVVIGQVHDPDNRQQTISLISPTKHPDEWVTSEGHEWAVQTPEGKWMLWDYSETWEDVEKFIKLRQESRWKHDEAEKAKKAA